MIKIVTTIISLALFTACSTDNPIKRETQTLPVKTVKHVSKKNTHKSTAVKHIKKIETIQQEKLQYQNPTEVSRICFDEVGKVKNCEYDMPSNSGY